MRAPTRQTCAACHFFIKEVRNGASANAFVISAADRTAAERKDFSWVKDYASLACAFGVWDEGVGYDAARRHGLIAVTDRTDFCFFFPHRPGMLLPAARTLQEREAADRKASRDRRFTIWGLWIAAGALVLDVIIKLLDAWR